jgi:DNA invertase Pin-like site-specific DNA recombinase
MAKKSALTRNNAPVRAAIYTRISQAEKDPKKAKALGVDRQEEDCRRLCIERGWEVVEPVYCDDGISASKYSTKPRPQYERLLNDIRIGRIDAIVVYAKDRLYRRPVELESLISLMEEVGITRLVSVDAELDVTDTEGRYHARIDAAGAARESDKISDRVRRQRQQVAEGKAPESSAGGSRPFGFEPDRVTIREPEAILVRSAAKRIREGGSLRAIVRDWTEANIPTASGAPWRSDTVRQILTHPRTNGRRQFRAREIGAGPDTVWPKAVWPAILDDEAFTAVGAILNDPSRKITTPSRRYPYRTILRCSVCGRVLGSNPTRRRLSDGTLSEAKRNYACRDEVSGAHKVGHVFIRADSLEKHLDSIIVPIADLPSTRQVLRDAEGAEVAGAAELIEANAVDNARLAGLADLVADGTFSPGHVRNAAADLKSAIAGREAKLAGLAGRSAVDRMDGHLAERWDSMPAEDKVAVIKSLVRYVTVSPPITRGRNTFDSRRLRIEWKFLALSQIEWPELIGEKPDDGLTDEEHYG